MANDEPPPKIKRKRPLSMRPDAVRKRRSREKKRQQKKLEKAGIISVTLQMTERDIHKLEVAGHLDARLERFDPDRAYREAIGCLVGAVGPADKKRF